MSVLPLPEAPVADRTPCITTVVVQPTPFCNIACRYCYLPDRDSTARMSIDTVRATFEAVFSSGWSLPDLTVIWHAGEPLVVPVSWYQEAFELIDALRPEGIRVRHAFQTNGTLITPDWCALFRRWEVGVGVSIDGPRDIHDANRVTRKGQGTFDKTLAGIACLQRENVPFHVISVLSGPSLADPEAMLAFYVENGIADICFNVEESEGDHVSSLLSERSAESRFSEFLTRFWHQSRHDESVRFLREIDSMIERIMDPTHACIENAQVQPFGMVNVDCKGNVSSFSPELLGMKNAEYENFIVGNIHHHSLDDMLDSASMRAMQRDISAGVEACRAECAYFSVCGGGSPINKLTENGSFSTTHTRFCDLIEKVPADIILDALSDLERTIDHDVPLRSAV